MSMHRRLLLGQISAGALVSALMGREAWAQTVSYTYDNVGRVKTVTYSDGATISYTYDHAGNRTQVAQAASTNAPTGTFSASPGSIALGGSATLSWTGNYASSASIDNGVGTVTPVAGGSVQVSPGATTTYTLTLTGPGGQTTKQATVTVSSSFNQTIQITGAGPVNLRSLANAAGYSGAQDATVTFVVGAGVTITGAAGDSTIGGGRAIETGTWPSGSHAITLTLQVSGKAHGGGGGGGRGAGFGSASLGTVGGDAIYAQENLSVVVNAGGEVKAGGGGGGGGGAWSKTWIDGEGFPETAWWNGGGGGGGFPNGVAGVEGFGDNDVSNAGAAGTISGGGAGGTAGACTPPPPGGSTRYNGAGGAGGGAAAAGSSGVSASGSGGTGTWWAGSAGGGGQPGYAVRKNGKTVSVTNNGTIVGAQG